MEKDFFEFEANKRLTHRNSQEKQANKAKEAQSTHPIKLRKPNPRKRLI